MKKNVASARKNKIRFMIVAVVFLFGIIGSLTYKCFLRNSQNKNLELINEVENTSFLSEPLPSLQYPIYESAEWKKYHSSIYGFVFDYPRDFYLNERKQSDGTYSLSINGAKDFDSSTSMSKGKMYIEVIVGKSDFERQDYYFGGYQWTKSIIEDYIDEVAGTEKEHKFDINTVLSTIRETTFYGVIYRSVPRKDISSSGFSRLNAAFINGDTTVLISSTVGGDSALIFSDHYSMVFDQLVSSFAFLD